MDIKLLIRQEEILRKSSLIRDAWNNFFWISHFCQKTIRFGDDERTNYVADLITYFEDTVGALALFYPQSADHISALYHSTAALQLMYIQQDLLFEMHEVFDKKFDSKIYIANADREQIRELRNKLTGHPISRRKRDGKLMSSVFLNSHMEGLTLSYNQYQSKTGYEEERVYHNWEDLFRTHANYVNESLDQLLDCIAESLGKYAEALISLREQAAQKSFVELVSMTNDTLTIYIEGMRLFNHQNLIYYYHKREEHPRYRFALYYFRVNLGEAIRVELTRLSKYNENTSVDSCNPCIDFGELEFSELDFKPSTYPPPHFHYNFVKLSFITRRLGVLKLFLTKFNGDSEVFAELENMNDSLEHIAEYECSYEYLRHIFKLRGWLTP